MVTSLPREEMLCFLRKQGATPGKPDRLPMAALETDRVCFAEAVCDRCEWTGSELEAWTGRRGEYRAVVVCTRCGFSWEA